MLELEYVICKIAFLTFGHIKLITDHKHCQTGFKKNIILTCLCQIMKYTPEMLNNEWQCFRWFNHRLPKLPICVMFLPLQHNVQSCC